MHWEICLRVSTEKLTLSDGSWWRKGKQWFGGRYCCNLVVRVPAIPKPMKMENKATQGNKTRGCRWMDAWSLWRTQWTRREPSWAWVPTSTIIRKGSGPGSYVSQSRRGESATSRERWASSGGVSFFTFLSLGKEKQLNFNAVDFSVPSLGILS